MSSRDMAKYAAMWPYFEVVAEAVAGLVGQHTGAVLNQRRSGAAFTDIAISS
jgi:hypothetical protein